MLPKLLPGEEFEATLNTSEESIEGSANTLMVGQIIATLALSVSLKQMWNLLNVMQVLAYFKHFSKFPAIIDSFITYIIDALYLKKVIDFFMNIGLSKFEQLKTKTKEEFLLEQGIMDESALKSLGIFAVFFFIIIVIMIIYFSIKYCQCCGTCV